MMLGIGAEQQLEYVWSKPTFKCRIPFARHILYSVSTIASHTYTSAIVYSERRSFFIFF